MGGFFGGGNAVEGLSPNASERIQRLQDEISREGLSAALDQRSLFNFLVGGGPFQQGFNWNSGKPVYGAFESSPSGPAFNVAIGGLNAEQDLSNARHNVAAGLLGNYGEDAPAARRFSQNQLGMGERALTSQEYLFGDQWNTFKRNLGLDETYGGSLGNYFQSGGAPSTAQEQAISGVFDAQRNIGTSNLQQQFQEALRGLEGHAARRGLDFGDTPIQDRGGLLTQELARNLTNLEAGIGGQQSAAMLDVPFRQAGLAGQLQGQTQGLNQDILNQFSIPISNAFGQQNAINSLGQFGAQYSPAAFQGAALQNMGALIGGGQFANAVPAFSPTPISQYPSFGRTLGQGFADSLGNSLGTSAGRGVSGGFSWLGSKF